jgi:hypothetical protein
LSNASRRPDEQRNERNQNTSDHFAKQWWKPSPDTIRICSIKRGLSLERRAI